MRLHVFGEFQSAGAAAAAAAAAASSGCILCVAACTRVYIERARVLHTCTRVRSVKRHAAVYADVRFISRLYRTVAVAGELYVLSSSPTIVFVDVISSLRYEYHNIAARLHYNLMRANTIVDSVPQSQRWKSVNLRANIDYRANLYNTFV